MDERQDKETRVGRDVKFPTDFTTTTAGFNGSPTVGIRSLVLEFGYWKRRSGGGGSGLAGMYFVPECIESMKLGTWK